MLKISDKKICFKPGIWHIRYAARFPNTLVKIVRDTPIFAYPNLVSSTLI